MVGRPSRISKSGRETLPEIRKWSGDPLKGLELVGRPFRRSEVVGRLSRRSETGRETLLEVRNWLGVSPGGPELVETPSRRSITGRENLPVVRK